MNKKIAIIGAGGHGKVVGEIAQLNGYNIVDFFDDNENLKKEEFFFPILGNLNFLKNSLKKYNAFFVAIGNNKIRFDKVEWLIKSGANIINLIHPRSTISKYTKLGNGICVMANSVVNPGSVVGNGVMINTSASIDHDCKIEDYVHISPNCSLSGNVKVGKFSHIGTGTSVHPGIEIGANVKVGIGSKIFNNVLDNTVYKI